MESLANFVFNHQELALLLLNLVIAAMFFGLSWYKKRHNNELPPRWAKLVVLWVGCNAIAFGGFCIGVLASHK